MKPLNQIRLLLMALFFITMGLYASGQSKVKTDQSGNFYAVSNRDPKILQIAYEGDRIHCVFKEGADTLVLDDMTRLQFDSAFHLNNTGKTYTDSKGNKHVVYESKKGVLYIWIISKKTGNAYKITIKPE